MVQRFFCDYRDQQPPSTVAVAAPPPLSLGIQYPRGPKRNR